MARKAVKNSPERAEFMAFEASRHFAIGVVIVNYRTPALVEACVESLAQMLAEADAGIVIVDNASMDGSYERLMAFCSAHPQASRIKVVASLQNCGFSAGNNIGVRSISAPLMVFLNSDAIALPGALAALAASARNHPKAGLYTPRITSSAGEDEVSRFRNLSPLSEFLDGAQTGPVTRLFHFAETPIFPGDLKSLPDWVSFAAVMIRREALDRVGPMDEAFFLYFEDCDYCRRVTAAGYDIAIALDAEFQHDPGGSTKLRETASSGARLPAYYYRSRSRYFRKYYGTFGPALANVAWAAGRAIARIRGVLGRPAPKVCDRRGRDNWIGWRRDERHLN